MGTIIPMLSQGLIPVFADIDDTLNMDPASVEACITPRTKAIVVVHLFGNPCDMDAMSAVASRHGIPLIEDCSQAHMTEYKGRMLGSIGQIGCFSFQQSKHMTTGDGGMTITSNPAYYERMKLFADKGYARKGWGSRAYLFHAPNYRMTELVGAVGLVQLNKVRGVVEKRRELGEHLSRLLAGIDGVEPAPVTPGGRHSYWLYPMRVRLPAEAVAGEMIKRKIWAMAGYTGKPIYLCSESLTSKRTYGTSEWPFNCNPGITYEYREGLCPKAEQQLEASGLHPLRRKPRSRVHRTDCRRGLELDRGADRAVQRGGGAGGGAARGSRTSQEAGAAPGLRDTEDPHRDRRLRPDGPLASRRLQGRSARRGGRRSSIRRSIGPSASPARPAAVPMPRTPICWRMNRSTRVSLCSVPSTHRDIAIDLLNAGANVLCEKPLAISVARGGGDVAPRQAAEPIAVHGVQVPVP